MSERINQVLEGIVERFKNGDIPQAVALSMFPIPNVPAANWSLLNRTLMFFSGTQDARGFKQWSAVGRRIKKGARAIHILGPRLKRIVDKETEEEKFFLKGFLTIPVFRMEDTEGDPLDYQEIKIPDFPLLEIAKEWGISVKAVPGNYRYYGYFHLDQNEIALASPEECVFFHELAHSAHHKITPLKPGQDWKQETVAELSAAALCHLVGKEWNLGRHYQYIEAYAQKTQRDVAQACLEVFVDVEKVLNLILGGVAYGGEANKQVA